MYEYAVATLNPISRYWIHGEATSEYEAEKKFNSLKAKNIRCRLIRRQITDWEMVKENEVKK